MGIYRCISTPAMSSMSGHGTLSTTQSGALCSSTVSLDILHLQFHMCPCGCLPTYLFVPYTFCIASMPSRIAQKRLRVRRLLRSGQGVYGRKMQVSVSSQAHALCTSGLFSHTAQTLPLLLDLCMHCTACSMKALLPPIAKR